MKKVLTTLCAAFIAGTGFAQIDYPFKEYDGDLYLRSGFTFLSGKKPEVPSAIEYFNNLYKFERNQETGIYHVAVELDKYHEGIPDKQAGLYGNCPYYYTTVFAGKNKEADAGAQLYQDKPRPFLLDGVDATSGKQTVNFYAKLTSKLNLKSGYDDTTPRIMFICDAQQLYYANTNYTETPFPLPDQEGRTRLVVGDGTETNVDMQYQIYTHTTDKWARFDVFRISSAEDTKYADLLPNGTRANGRWMFEYDYTTLTLTLHKMLDQLQNAAVTVSGSRLTETPGEFTIQTALNLGGTLTTFTFDKANSIAAEISPENVTARLCYQIDERPMSSINFPTGTKELLQYNHEQINYALEGQNILQGQSLSNGEHNLKVWFEVEYLGDILKDDNNGACYTTTFTINNTSLPLTNIGTAADLVLTGDWNADTFNTLIAADKIGTITTIDFIGVKGLTDLPVIEGLNPNCLIYVDQSVTIAEGTNNIVVFNEEAGRAANVVLTEGHDFNNVKSFTAGNISYSRNFTDTSWFTMSLPFNADKCNMIVESFNRVDGDELIFKRVDSVMANTPYLVKTESTGDKRFVATEKVFASTADILPVSPVSGYTFHVNYRLIEGTDAVGLYLMNNVGTAFAKVAEGNPNNSAVPAFRAYLSTAADRRLSIAHDNGGATNISAMNVADELVIISRDGLVEIITGKAQVINIYGLDGRLVKVTELNEGTNRIDGLDKGIYIMNYQKIVVK